MYLKNFPVNPLVSLSQIIWSLIAVQAQKFKKYALDSYSFSFLYFLQPYNIITYSFCIFCIIGVVIGQLLSLSMVENMLPEES